MNDVLGLSLQGTDKPINEDIIVVFTPEENVVSYDYVLYKDGEEISSEIVSSKKEVSIIMSETGVYKLVVTTKDGLGSSNVITSDEYEIDKESPVITTESNLFTIKKGEVFSVLNGVNATDNVSGNLTSSVTSNYSEIDFSTLGLKELTYTVIDEAGNVGVKTVNINVVKGVSDSLIYVQLGIAIVLIIFLFMVNSFIKSIKLERRISKYSIEPIKDDSFSLWEKFQNFYSVVILKISNFLSKSVFLIRYAKRFDKYVGVFDRTSTKGMDLVSTKVIIGLLFVLIAFFSKILQYQVVNVYETLIPFLIGFFVPDIIYMYNYRIYRNKLENDLLQAIIIMNNAFKSGRSIIQAIEMVSKELNGPMAEEFKKMYMEMSFGLGVDVIFKRFADRIDLEEVNHLTASLSILNKTGGNIVKVFSSIEKSLFSKKRLKLELAALIGSSKMIVYVLFLVPLFFIVLVSIINPSYFMPFFTNPIGIMLLVFMIVYYVVYIIIIRRIMQVRM